MGTRSGDFAEEVLGRVVDNRCRNALIVRDWKRLAEGRKTIVFAATVKHAQDLADAFQTYDVNAEAVWSDDPERDSKLKRHQKGLLKVLCNCGILTEGYDDWAIRCIVMARPTLSKLLFVQMIGRGTRIEDGITNLVEADRNGLPIRKRDCMIIDVVDNTSKHNLVTCASLLNLPIDSRGESLREFARQPVRERSAVSAPYLTPAEMERIENIPTYIEYVDLLGRTRCEQVSDPDFDPSVLGSGNIRAFHFVHAKAWECEPGDWRVSYKHGNSEHIVPNKFTQTEAKAKALEIARRLRDWRY